MVAATIFICQANPTIVTGY